MQSKEEVREILAVREHKRELAMESLKQAKNWILIVHGATVKEKQEDSSAVLNQMAVFCGLYGLTLSDLHSFLACIRDSEEQVLSFIREESGIHMVIAKREA